MEVSPCKVSGIVVSFSPFLLYRSHDNHRICCPDLYGSSYDSILVYVVPVTLIERVYIEIATSAQPVTSLLGPVI